MGLQKSRQTKGEAGAAETGRRARQMPDLDGMTTRGWRHRLTKQRALIYRRRFTIVGQILGLTP